MTFWRHVLFNRATANPMEGSPFKKMRLDSEEAPGNWSLFVPGAVVRQEMTPKGKTNDTGKQKFEARSITVFSCFTKIHSKKIGSCVIMAYGNKLLYLTSKLGITKYSVFILRSMVCVLTGRMPMCKQWRHTLPCTTFKVDLGQPKNLCMWLHAKV